MNWALLRNSGLATLGILVQGLARFIYTILVGRGLGAETLGQVSGLLALAVFVSLLWPTASGVAASRYIPRDRAAGLVVSPSVAVLSKYFLLSLPLLSVATFAIALVLTRNAGAAIAGVALMATYSAYMFTRGVKLGESKFLRIAVWDFASASASILFLTLVLIGGWHWAVLLPLSLGYAVFALCNWPREKLDDASLDRKELRDFVWINSIAQVAAGGLLQVAMLVAAVADSPRQAGLFAAALSLATPAAMVGQSLNQVLIPHFAGLHTRGSESITASTIRITLIIAAGLGVAFATIGFLTPLILRVVYGPQFLGGSAYMYALLVGVYIFAVSLVPAATLIATGRDREFTVASVFGFVVGVVTMGTSAIALGAWAAAVGYLIGTGVSAALTIWWGTRGTALKRWAP